MSRASTLICAAAMLAAAAGAAGAAQTLPIGDGARAQVAVKSLVELRFVNVVRQRFDLSCGAAAVSTLFTYFYGDETSENEIIEDIFEFGDKEKIQKEGFSMLELKRYGDRRGYAVQGFRIPEAENLAKLQVPVLTLVNTRGYNHFVVIKGVQDGRVLIADPAFGNRSLSLSSFKSEWSNVILVYLSPKYSGDSDFQVDGSLRADGQQVMILVDRVLHTIRPLPGEF